MCELWGELSYIFIGNQKKKSHLQRGKDEKDLQREAKLKKGHGGVDLTAPI